MLKMNHQIADPKKTPVTSAIEDENSWVVAPRPIPAKIAMKDKIVVGLLTVKKNVVMKLLKSPLLSMFAGFEAGFEKNDFTPKTSKNKPPMSFIQYS